MKVKGTLVLDYVKMIRENRDLGWDEYLEPEDWKIVDGQVLSSSWYPYESFRRIGFAVFKIIGRSNLESAHAYGRMLIRDLLEIYRNLLAPGDPRASVENLTRIRKTFFDGDVYNKVKDHGDGWLIMEFTSLPDEDLEHLEPFCHTAAGNVEELVEQAGGKNINLDIDIKGNVCEIRAEWE